MDWLDWVTIAIHYIQAIPRCGHILHTSLSVCVCLCLCVRLCCAIKNSSTYSVCVCRCVDMRYSKPVNEPTKFVWPPLQFSKHTLLLT